MKPFTTFTPTQFVFGAGSLEQLASLPLAGAPKKALIVISAGTSMKRHGYLERVINLLEGRGITCITFDKVLANPIKDHVMEASAICRSEQCDLIVALGGGSTMDSAKASAFMACNDGDYWDYIHGGSGKAQTPTGGALPLIAIPTTAGTGTEVDPWTVITHNEEKIGYGIPALFPLIAIVDPELMLTVPPTLTAHQGFDAFFHAAEGYIANCATPISDLYALKSIELIAKSLPTAVAQGDNIEARSDVALASSLSGLVESTSSCTSEHSLEHAMSGFYPALPHGAGLIAISIAYFRSFMDVSAQRMMRMAECMTGKPSTSPEDFITALAELQKACGVDNIKLSDYGIKASDLPRLSTHARETMGGLYAVDPRPLSDEEVLHIFEASFK